MKRRVSQDRLVRYRNIRALETQVKKKKNRFYSKDSEKPLDSFNEGSNLIQCA